MDTPYRQLSELAVVERVVGWMDLDGGPAESHRVGYPHDEEFGLPGGSRSPNSTVVRGGIEPPTPRFSGLVMYPGVVMLPRGAAGVVRAGRGRARRDAKTDRIRTGRYDDG